MNHINQKIINTFLALFIILISAAFFVPAYQKEAQAQANTTITFCYTEETAEVILRSPQGACPPGSEPVTRPRVEQGICIIYKSGGPPYKIAGPPYKFSGPAMIPDKSDPKKQFPRFNTNGECLPYDLKSETPFGAFKKFPTVSYVSTTTNNNGNNVNNANNANNNNGGGNNGGGTVPTPPRDGCEAEFHKVGPLCVPNSPFNNGGSITSERTVGGLAARIIKLLLYFAGIIAVVMIIIGGYQVMTAAGNAAQAANGKKTLINALIGLVIIILSYVIVQAVISFVT